MAPWVMMQNRACSQGKHVPGHQCHETGAANKQPGGHALSCGSSLGELRADQTEHAVGGHKERLHGVP